MVFSPTLGRLLSRRMPMKSFYVWPGETVMKMMEFIRAIEVPRIPLRN
jgi:CO/xanthine dehydrogenase FAD-binding subunit